MTPTSEAAFLSAGVRFPRVSVPSHTHDGHAITLTLIKPQGPRDEALMGALKAEVARRVPMLRSLEEARRLVWDGYKGPTCKRSGVHMSGPLKGQAWTVESLPDGVCETCGEPGGSGMCALCMLARWHVVMGKESRV